jgi:hypothetical protein
MQSGLDEDVILSMQSIIFLCHRTLYEFWTYVIAV